LMVRKGRTILTGLAVAIGVASIFSLLIVGESGSITMERQARSHFGFADVRVYPDPMVDKERITKELADLPGVKGVAFEKLWFQEGDLDGQKVEFHIKGIESENAISHELYPLLNGRLPKTNGEVALSAAFARNRGYQVGQTFTLPLKSTKKGLKITGLINDGPSITSVTANIYVGLPLFNKIAPEGMAGDAGSIQAILDKDKSQKQVLVEIGKLDGVEYAASAEMELDDARKSADVFKKFFGIIGAISLMVGMTLIYTTFAISAAERESEFGLMKAIGANRRWVRRLIYREAALLGLAFSVAGLLFGVVLSFAFMWLGMKTGVFQGIGLSDLTISAGSVIISLAAGIIATFFSALLPARKVGKVSPLASIRPQPVSEQRVGKTRWLGLALIIAGSALLYNFTTLKEPRDTEFFIAVGGTLTAYLGLAIFMPVIIGPIFNLLERMSLRKVGASGKLAAKNASYQRVRSARTTTSVLIGISLVSLIATLSTSSIMGIRLSAEEQVKYDIAVSSPENEPPATVTKSLLDELEALDEVDFLTTIRWGTVKVERVNFRGEASKLSEGRKVPFKIDTPVICALNPTQFPKVSNLFFLKDKDSKRVWDEFHGKYVMVNKNWAKLADLKPGDKIKLTGKDGGEAEFQILTYADAFFLGARRSMGSIFMSQANAEQYLGIIEDYDVLIKLKSGADKKAVKSKIGHLIKGGRLETRTSEQILDWAANLDKGPQAFFYLIFGVTVFVSLLGVINTAAMSVLERLREIGLVKAVGGTRRQIKLMIMLETTLIAVFGAVLGSALGTAASALFNSAIHAEDFIPTPFVFPTITIVLVLLAVVVVSAIGSSIPVRLANKVTPVEALKAE